MSTGHDADDDVSFLDTDPPHWVARGLGWLLLALFVTAAAVVAFVRIPETVSSPFVLVPVRGADPVRSPQDGVVTEVGAREGQSVHEGEVLYEIRSNPGDASGASRLLSPCEATVIRRSIQAAGAVVMKGDALCELACAGDALQAQLSVPPEKTGRLEPGQGVKLFYDAYPYQRYGVRYATLRWVSPASVRVDGAYAVPALARLSDPGNAAADGARVLRAGMGGTAEIVIGRRSLLSYAFEPFRAVREHLASPPETTDARAAEASEHDHRR